jgi:hypothetical protein
MTRSSCWYNLINVFVIGNALKQRLVSNQIVDKIILDIEIWTIEHELSNNIPKFIAGQARDERLNLQLQVLNT